MNNKLFWILGAVVLGGIGGKIGIKAFHRETRIEFKMSKGLCFAQAFIMFVVISLVMALELDFNAWQLTTWESTCLQIQLFRRLIDAGLLIAILAHLISRILGKWMESFDLDLCREYNENTVKFYFSCVVAINCMWYLFVIEPNIMSQNLSVNNILSRVIIWMINILGTWFGIGFHCKGRINEEIDNFHRSKEKVKWREQLRFNVPFLGALIVSFAFLLIQSSKVQILLVGLMIFYASIMCILIGMLFAVLVCGYIECPSEKRSNRKLSRAVSKINDLKQIKEHYKNIQYFLINHDNEKKYLIICKQNVIWEGHEMEVETVFGKKEICLDTFDYLICQKYLKGIVQEQKNFFQNSYAKCRDNVKEQLRDEKLKRLS